MGRKCNKMEAERLVKSLGTIYLQEVYLLDTRKEEGATLSLIKQADSPTPKNKEIRRLICSCNSTSKSNNGFGARDADHTSPLKGLDDCSQLSCGQEVNC